MGRFRDLWNAAGDAGREAIQGAGKMGPRSHGSASSSKRSQRFTTNLAHIFSSYKIPHTEIKLMDAMMPRPFRIAKDIFDPNVSVDISREWANTIGIGVGASVGFMAFGIPGAYIGAQIGGNLGTFMYDNPELFFGDISFKSQRMSLDALRISRKQATLNFEV